MPAITVADALVKTYGKTWALDGFNLAVPEGIAVGLLGPTRLPEYPHRGGQR